MTNIHFALATPHAKRKYCYSNHRKADHSETVIGPARSTKSNLYRTDLLKLEGIPFAQSTMSNYWINRLCTWHINST